MSRSFGVRSLTTWSPIELSLGDLLESRDHPQRRRLAAAGRPDHHHQLTVLDRQIEVQTATVPSSKTFETSLNFDPRQLGSSFELPAYFAGRLTAPCRGLAVVARPVAFRRS